MSGYDYEYFVKDFINRTQVNLSTIDEMAKSGNDSKVYEITQLINSLFGLLIVPNEYYRLKMNKRNDEADILSDKDGYSKIVSIINEAKKENRLRTTYEKDKNQEYQVRNFLTHLRNALAHSGNGRLVFWPCDEDKEIEEVFFCDLEKDKNEMFCVKLNIQTISELKDSIASIYSSVDKCNDIETIHEKREKYEKSINNKNDFLEGKVHELQFD